MKRVFLIAVLALVGCGAEPTMPMDVPAVISQGRITVTRIGVFEDGLAYNYRRGVYIIKDTDSGKEFIGISGVGIAETGSHLIPAGKVMVPRQDER